MGKGSGIEWIRGDDGSAGATWNPFIAIDRVTQQRGSFCIHKSEGCRYCWADRMNVFRGTGLKYIAQNLDRHRFEIITDPRSQRSIDWPLRQTKPLRIFPCSMTDLFAPWYSDEMIDQAFATMALAYWHTFIITTKEAERMADYLRRASDDYDFGENPPDGYRDIGRSMTEGYIQRRDNPAIRRALRTPNGSPPNGWEFCSSLHPWPLPNVWMGVSVEDQKNADERIRYLLQAPASVRWVSVEPMLAAINLSSIRCIGAGFVDALTGQGHDGSRADGTLYPSLDWVVVGGESGPGARPVHPEWVRSLRDQCAGTNVCFFFKQWGAWQPVCALYPSTEAEHDEHESAGCCGDIELQTNGVIPNGYQPSDPRTWLMDRVGKKEAGRTLDGCEWNQFPV